MREVELEVEAFGPYPGSEVVDFTDLSAAGLFLIYGRTGSGKTSLLDALCFALFGEVPGTRASVTRLRSDHAPSSAVPRVAVELEIGGRLYRVERSPAFERRGRATPVPAGGTFLRFEGSAWRPVATKVREVDQLVRDLVGLDANQFQQVVLLPQGLFQRALQSDAGAREELLRSLFQTERFKHYAERLDLDAKAAVIAVDRAEGSLQGAEERIVEEWTRLVCALDAETVASARPAIAVDAIVAQVRALARDLQEDQARGDGEWQQAWADVRAQAELLAR